MRTVAASEPFGYKAQWGYYTDSETGLQLLTHRYYDPQAGRFLTRDPIGYGGGVNLYAYVTNSPTGFIDPLGLDKFTLPPEPGPNGENMPEGWQKDPNHKSPNGERWVSPDGSEGLEFDRGIPGEPGYRGKDHWAKLKPKRWPPDELEKDKNVGNRGHLLPGEGVDLKSCIVPVSYNPWPTIPNIPPPPLAAQVGMAGTVLLIVVVLLVLA
jgi:RHS repeat-associated protein